MKFQGLAVVLAKKRWTDLIACERKKDKGADAITKVPFAADGVGKVLACSTTATIAKIRLDAEKVKKHFKGITKIIFATPSAVSNEVSEQWVEEIKKDFGFDLAIMPREDITTSLMEPGNAALLATHLGIQVDIEPALAELIQKVKEAAAEVSAAWMQRFIGKPLLELRALRLDRDGRDSSEVMFLGDFRAGLLQGERIVLEGPAGRGKTTTLTQLASAHSGATGTPFLIDLTAWTSSRAGVLQFIAGMPQFQRRALDATILARVNAVEHFSFLLNGWNEIGEPEFPHAESALRNLERDFPAAGVIVATRTHHIVPPLPGATRARLLMLTRHERSSYLKTRLGARADELRLKLDADAVLDDLTRTPFFLSEVTSIFEAGAPIPSTKIGVLQAVTRLVEQSDEHRNYLKQPPLAGLAHDYLAELATRMTAQNAVSISEEQARPTVAAVGNSLKEVGQISAVPEPGTVLATLCAHHVLERQDYPEPAFRFAHQQFQEFYAAVGVGKQLYALLGASEQEKLEFTKHFVNEPAWAEPLRLLADHIRGGSEAADRDRATQAGALLVTMALTVDPVFAAELAHYCGAQIWKEIRAAVGDRLRHLYASPDKNYRNCALAGMLASGSDDFKDIIEPILSGDDQQAILGTYRRWDEFHLSSLGPNWRETVAAWSEAARVSFVSELLHHRHVPEVAEFALTDPSLKVKTAAVSGLSWIGAEEDVSRALVSLDDLGFESIVEKLDPEFIPRTARDRTIRTLWKRHGEQTDPQDRLGTLLKLDELGVPDLIEQLKADLGSINEKIDNHRAHYVVRPALDMIRTADPTWAGAWVAEKVAEGSLWYESWEKMITAVPEKLKEDLLRRFETEDFKHIPFGNILSVLTAAADVAMAERIFAKLCELRRVISSAPDQRHELEWAIERQLETLMRSLPSEISVGAISKYFANAVDADELSVITRLFSRVSHHEPNPLDELNSQLREGLRGYLKAAAEFVLQQDDFSGELKANVGSVLAVVGLPEDMKEMRTLIQTDIERVRKGRAARAKGDRGKRGNGGSISYSNWHVRSIVKLDPVNSEADLLELLNEPEYERDVSGEFVRQVQPPPAKEGVIFEKVNYGRIWEARAGYREEPNKERRARYAEALRSRIEALMKERQTEEQKRPLEFRLRVLGLALARVDAHGSADLVFKVMSLPDEWDNYSRIEAFEALLFGGVILPADITMTLIDPCLERWRKYGIQQNDEWLLKRYLCLLPFVDDPAKGIERMKQLMSELRIYGYEARGVLEALGHCRCDQALPFLQEITSDKGRAEHFGDAWIDAVASLDTAEARKLLLSFVDPALPGLPSDVTFSKEDILVARIVALLRKDKAVEERLLHLCGTDLPPAKRGLLAKVIGQLGTVDAVVAGLNLIDDGARDAVPYEIWKQLEDAFVEKRTSGQSQNTFTLEPRSSNAIRAKLLDMAKKDERRKKSALRLLSQIEEWRLEYGRPAGESRHPAVGSGEPWPPM